jgi:hypothetical protein
MNIAHLTSSPPCPPRAFSCAALVTAAALLLSGKDPAFSAQARLDLNPPRAPVTATHLPAPRPTPAPAQRWNSCFLFTRKMRASNPGTPHMAQERAAASTWLAVPRRRKMGS